MYAITATFTRQEGEWSSTRQVPTFYLDERVQGILNEAGAVKVARTIVDPLGQYEVHITAVKVS